MPAKATTTRAVKRDLWRENLKVVIIKIFGTFWLFPSFHTQSSILLRMRELIFIKAQSEASWCGTPTVNMLKALFLYSTKSMKFNIQYHRDEFYILLFLYVYCVVSVGYRPFFGFLLKILKFLVFFFSINWQFTNVNFLNF